MLVLTRREDIVVTVVSIQGNKVRLGVSAPDDVAIRRGELLLDADATLAGRQLAEQV
jgi:carbon storage regulator CsrA